jgi:hypothetical protein
LEQNQNVLIWSANYRNKTGTFQSVPKNFKIESERLHTPSLQSKQNGTFANYFQIFFTSLERFSLLQTAEESKQNVFIFKK